MRTPKSTVVSALLALLLSASVSVMAQQAIAPNDQKPKADSCCAMDSCCCKGDSCDMKKDGQTAAGDCCCKGDSCDMAKQDGQDKKDHSDACCNMKHKDMKQKDNKKKPA